MPPVVDTSFFPLLALDSRGAGDYYSPAFTAGGPNGNPAAIGDCDVLILVNVVATSGRPNLTVTLEGSDADVGGVPENMVFTDRTSEVGSGVLHYPLHNVVVPFGRVHAIDARVTVTVEGNHNATATFSVSAVVHRDDH